MFKALEEYETLFRLAWILYSAGDDRLVAVKDRPSAAPAAGFGPATPAPADPGKVCGHFKKHGLCKFGDDKKCKNGLHSLKFKKSADGSVALPAPKGICAVLAADIARDCRRCKKAFNESFEYWTVTLTMESMHWHCDVCRALNREEKKALKAANEIVDIPAVVPLVDIDGADSEAADADANHWNEVLNWDDECDVSLVIASDAVEVPLKKYNMKVGKSIDGSPFCEIGTVNRLAEVADPEWSSDT